MNTKGRVPHGCGIDGCYMIGDAAEPIAAQAIEVWSGKMNDGSIILRLNGDGTITTVITRDDGGPALTIGGDFEPWESLDEAKASYNESHGVGGLPLNWRRIDDGTEIEGNEFRAFGADPSAGHHCDRAEDGPPSCTHQPLISGDPNGAAFEFGEPDCEQAAVYLIDGAGDRTCSHACLAHILETLGWLRWAGKLTIFVVPQGSNS